MGIAKDFNKVLHEQIRVHAAWLPVTNTFQVGDFGMISDGVFVPMGNIQQDFDVGFETQSGNGAKLDFTSESVRVFRLAAGAKVTVFPGEDVDASLKIEFGKDRSFFLKAGLTVSEMQGVFKAARDLGSRRGWDFGKFKVVSAVYTAADCVILSSKTSNASIEISGKAGALKRLEIGAAEAGLTISSKSGLGLEIIGETGVVGLRLFKVEKDGRAGLESARGARGVEEGFSSSEKWGADLEDDL